MPYKCDQCGEVVCKYQWPLCPHEEEFQRYVGPKMTVWAASISRIEPLSPNMRAYPTGAPLKDSGFNLWLEVANPMPLTDGHGITVDDEWLDENEPAVGGYHCLDTDEQPSYVAADIFEKHYKPVPSG